MDFLWLYNNKNKHVLQHTVQNQQNPHMKHNSEWLFLHQTLSPNLNPCGYFLTLNLAQKITCKAQHSKTCCQLTQKLCKLFYWTSSFVTDTSSHWKGDEPNMFHIVEYNVTWFLLNHRTGQQMLMSNLSTKGHYTLQRYRDVYLYVCVNLSLGYTAEWMLLCRYHWNITGI